MLNYEQFQEKVFQVRRIDAEEWLHLLPAVPMVFRVRFIETLETGLPIPLAFDMITLSTRLNDEQYQEYLREAVKKKADLIKKGRSNTN